MWSFWRAPVSLATDVDSYLPNDLAKEFGYNVFALEPEGPRFLQTIETSQLRRNYLFTAMSPAELDLFMSRTRSASAQSRS